MKHVFVVIAFFFFTNLAFSQIVTDTSRGLSMCRYAVIDIYTYGTGGTFVAEFDNGSIINLKDILNVNAKGGIPSPNQKILLAMAYMQRKGFSLVNSLSTFEHFNTLVFERK